MEDKMETEVRRIFLKLAVLKIIQAKPIHGYDIIKEIVRVSGGEWVPSCGSIYPILEGFEAKGYVKSEIIDRKKVYMITPEGESIVKLHMEKKVKLIDEMTRVINGLTGKDENEN